MRLHTSIVCVSITLLALWSTSASAQTARIRITSSEAVIRQSADPQSPPVATVKAGTVLEIAAERNGWYEVILPATATSAQSRGYIPAELAEPFGLESRPSLGLPSTGRPDASKTAPSAQGTVAADFQARYDRAVRRKRAASVKVWIGLPVMVTGGVLMVYPLIRAALGTEEDSLQRLLPVYGTGVGMVAGGAALAITASRQMQRASEELLLIETERTRAQQGIVYSRSISNGTLQTNVDVGVGRHLSAAIRMSW